MFYTIYKITNLLDGKIYIGKHQTQDLNDGYMGSGKHLKRAQVKHGIDNFKKEILFQFDNEDEMNAKEAELVTEEFARLKSNYNICPGGQGGWGYVNKIESSLRSVGHTREMYERVSNTLKGRQPSEEALNAVRRRHAEGKVDYATFSGKSHSEEAKKKIGKSNSKLVGSKNSQFGTMWITDGQTNRKIKKIDIIPEEWYKGRK
jgi:group I intron endonuclease